MSSTNKTVNYELSQFLGTDKPAWLGDYNVDMGKIDAQMKLNATAASAAQGTATAAAAGLGDVTELTTTDKSSAVAAINEVDTAAETAQQTANTAAGAAATANNAIEALKSYLDLNTINALTFTTSAGSVSSQTSMTIAKNSTNSLCKIYGQVVLNSFSGSGTATITSSDTGLRPESAITINGATLYRQDTSSGSFVSSFSYTINTNGTITATLPRGSYNAHVAYFEACLIFVKDFGDVIEPPLNP